MSDIGPGDWVECVDNSPRLASQPAGYSLMRALDDYMLVGALYCVRRIWVDEEVGPLVELVGVSTGRSPRALERFGDGFHLSRFRPIRDGQERITREALRRKPADNRVTA